MKPEIQEVAPNIQFAAEHLVWKRGKQIEDYKLTKECDQLKRVVALIGMLWNSDPQHGKKHIGDSMSDDRDIWNYLSGNGITLNTSELITGILEEIRTGGLEIARNRSDKRKILADKLKSIGSK